MACGGDTSRSSGLCSRPEDAFVSDRDHKDQQCLKEAMPHSLFNEILSKDKPANTFERSLSVIIPRDQSQQILRKRSYLEQDSVRNSIASSETSTPALHSRHTNSTMPLTPPLTPTKSEAAADMPAISTHAPTRPARQLPKGFRFGQPVPKMPARKRPRIVYEKVKTSDGRIVDRRTSVQKIEKERPVSTSMPARTAALQPEYPNPHFGDPCTHESLDHILGCGHRVTTSEPEPCSSNCHVRDPPDYAQARDLDSPFICMVCIADHLQATNDARLNNFITEIAAEAVRLGKGHDWIEWKVGLMAPGWSDENLREMKQKSEKGKFCHALWIEPDWRHLVDMVMHERQQLENSRRRPSLASLASVNTAARPSTASSRPSLDNGPPSPTSSIATTTSFRPKHLPELRSSVRKLFAGRETKDTLSERPTVNTAADATSGANDPVAVLEPPSPSSTVSQSTIKTESTKDS